MRSCGFAHPPADDTPERETIDVFADFLHDADLTARLDALTRTVPPELVADAWGARARMADARRAAGVELDDIDEQALARYPDPPRIPTTQETP